MNFPGCLESLGCPEKPEFAVSFVLARARVYHFQSCCRLGSESEYIQFVVDEESKIIPPVSNSIEFQ